MILTDEYKVTNIWMEYFPLLQNDSFTDIKLIPVWCLDFEVNGNGAEDGGNYHPAGKYQIGIPEHQEE